MCIMKPVYALGKIFQWGIRVYCMSLWRGLEVPVLVLSVHGFTDHVG